jgi:uracil-DNA glycosylase family 4
MKNVELLKIAEEIAKCKICKKGKFGLPVPGEGNPNTKIMFLGEAPGPSESKIGRPFVGRSGKFLTKMLEKIGIKREDVFITSPVKYYPGKRAPDLEEIRHGMTHTRKQIEAIKPKIIVLLGNVAVKALIDEKLRISDIHGKLIEKEGVNYFPTFHPSAAMRFTKVRLKMEEDLKKLKTILK